jgi:hypothetical protein
VKARDLLGDVGIHELHEAGELLSVGWRQQEMSMIGGNNEGMDGHSVQVLSLADDANYEIVELGGRLEQKPALDGAGRDLHEGAFWNEAQRS